VADVLSKAFLVSAAVGLGVVLVLV
jgi:hypothetical protein